MRFSAALRKSCGRNTKTGPASHAGDRAGFAILLCLGSLVVGVTEGIVIEVYHAGFVVAIQAVEHQLFDDIIDDREERHADDQAYTSPTIRRILARRGIDIPGFVPALEQLSQDGVERVYVLPTHLLPGYEYDDLLEAAEQMRPQFQQLRMAPSLLGDTWGVRALAQILCDRFPCQEGQAVVLLGHGTEHPGNLVYPALQGVLDWLGREDILIGTVEGWPQAEDVLEQLSRQNCHRVLLAPLMLVAGTHAAEDMAGPEPESWKNRLEASGYEVTPIFEGLGRLPQVQEMYVHRLKMLVEENHGL